MSTEKLLLTLCETSAVPEGRAVRVEQANMLLAVFNLAGTFYVTDDTCTHGPGSLSQGEIDGDIVECDFHAGCFHIPTGRVESPPCMIPVNTYAVHIIDGRVCIDPEPRPLAQ
jgi:nitrite reductase/ring-hydroxylating ferredoxin subunit